ncbi:MAG TPA: 50S ribosomal protein L11 methyltransferase [Solirubrobacteraceae bacterium]|nr:50S ribosomal protein L11 methyltransferase [Solirubrobacteraceae bacterium]
MSSSGSAGSLVRLAIRVDRDHAELVLAELVSLVPGGVEEVDVSDAVVEYAVYGVPGELPSLPDLRAAAGGALVDVSTSSIAGDWATRWREFHRPLVLGDRLTVRPPWEPPASTPLDVVIDPGQAFGTGAHATTRMCLELLLGEADGAGGLGSCVDLGCGSGVLAICAALLGFSLVVALDVDPAAVSACVANAAANGVSIDVRRFDLRSEQAPFADLVVANVLAPPLLAWAGLQERLPPRLVLSGLLAGSEVDRVASAYVARGMVVSELRDDGEWAALLLTRRAA